MSDQEAKAPAAPVLIEPDKPKTLKVRSLMGPGIRCVRHGLGFESSDVIEVPEDQARAAAKEFPEEFEIVGEEKPKKVAAPEAPKNTLNAV